MSTHRLTTELSTRKFTFRLSTLIFDTKIFCLPSIILSILSIVDSDYRLAFGVKYCSTHSRTRKCDRTSVTPSSQHRLNMQPNLVRAAEPPRTLHEHPEVVGEAEDVQESSTSEVRTYNTSSIQYSPITIHYIDDTFEFYKNP